MICFPVTSGYPKEKNFPGNGGSFENNSISLFLIKLHFQNKLTQMTAEMLHKFYAYVLVFLPEFDVSVCTGSYDEVCSIKIYRINVICKRQFLLLSRILFSGLCYVNAKHVVYR